MTIWQETGSPVKCCGDGNIFTSPFMRCVVCFCQSVSLKHTCTYKHTQKQRSHAYTYIHTHTKKPCCQSVFSKRQETDRLFCPLAQVPKLWPGCCRESTVCHTLQIQATLCHTQITSLSLVYVSISFYHKPGVHICMHARMHDTHSYTLQRN